MSQESRNGEGSDLGRLHAATQQVQAAVIEILMNALDGQHPDYRSAGGYIRWGLVERDIKEKISAFALENFAQSERRDTTDEAEEERERRKYTQQWYAERLEWLKVWFRTTGKDLQIADQFWHIIANGTPGTSTPPTYQQILNMTKHSAAHFREGLVQVRDTLATDGGGAFASTIAEIDKHIEEGDRMDWSDRYPPLAANHETDKPNTPEKGLKRG